MPEKTTSSLSVKTKSDLIEIIEDLRKQLKETESDSSAEIKNNKYEEHIASLQDSIDAINKEKIEMQEVIDSLNKEVDTLQIEKLELMTNPVLSEDYQTITSTEYLQNPSKLTKDYHFILPDGMPMKLSKIDHYLNDGDPVWSCISYNQGDPVMKQIPENTILSYREYVKPIKRRS